MFLESRAQVTGNELADLLRRAGHEISLAVVDRFPVADPLAERLAYACSDFDSVVILISQSTPEAHWILREVQMRRRMIVESGSEGMPFVVFMAEAEVPERMPQESYVDLRRFGTMNEAAAQVLSSIACA